MAAHERGDAPAGVVERRSPVAPPGGEEDLHRLLAPAHGHRAGRLHGDVSAHGLLGGSADQHGAGRGEGLEARGDVHRVADSGQVGVAARAELPHHHDAGAHADAHPHERVAALGPLPRDALLQGQGREHRPQGVVLVGRGGADQRQEAVAQVLVDRSAEPPDLLARDLEEAVEHLVHRLLADPLGHGGGADHVAEDRGQDPPLARLLALAGQPRPALLAQPLPGGGRRATARASRVVRAEFRASHGPRLPRPPGNGDDRRAQAVSRPSTTSRRRSRPAVITPASRDSMS